MNVINITIRPYRTETLRTPLEKEELRAKAVGIENKITYTKTAGFNAAVFAYSRRSMTNRTNIQNSADEYSKRIEAFKATLQSMIFKQGQQSNLVLFDEQLRVISEQSVSAAAAIADGGYYLIVAVTERITDMVKALAEKDASKLAILKNAVIEGFKAAESDFGGELPDICKITYDEVMEQFCELKNEFNIKN